MILKGNLVADSIYESFHINGLEQKLAIITDESADGRSYLHSIQNAAKKWGVETFVGTEWTEEMKDANSFIDLRSNQNGCDAPLWLRDVDGARRTSQEFTYYTGRPWTSSPCTPEAIIRLLTFYDIPIKGKTVCIIGRGDKVGKPLAAMMTKLDATVILCHSKTPDATLRQLILQADIVIAASGKRNLFGVSDIRCGATVVNVGGDFSEPNGDFKSFTLVPFRGGVGPVTTAVLMAHVLGTI